MHRVLIVDDEPSLRRLTSIALSKSGSFEPVGEAADGLEAASQALALQPDLVLLDLIMPRMDGFQALPLIRRNAPAAAIVMYSMISDPRSEAQAKALGAIAYIDKGCSNRELIHKLRELMASARLDPLPARPSSPVPGGEA